MNGGRRSGATPSDNGVLAFAPPEIRRKAAGIPSQSEIGMLEVARCLAQILHEADPSVAARLSFMAGKSFNRLTAAGDKEAAAIVYAFGRLLLDRDAFPTPDDTERS